MRRQCANAIAQATGCKGKYALMELKNHNPLTPDAMHTVKVVAEHLFMLIIGKDDSVKVRQAEVELGRFETPIAPTRKQKRNALPTAPFRISQEQLKVADKQACAVSTCRLHS